ncbi:alpha-amylase family glycosyl hydrolase [Porphyrobacter sp. ULC335]|uniref:alpha-amylase family glycosyl hydrolase n=1 Tax=Porphyrobacter sp. ULC335 TaxID=2854260 RepID=UPI002220BFD6|nr:alpha-amylase family glycosyl hydrolase [Porphyrobacter sp. ULC335]UYV15552.1 alpha-glucosidase C-terminal domain-containing protein [Porphyrobacter sp. ULC335]
MRIATALLASALAANPALAEPDYAPRDVVEATNAEWTRDAVLYQLNTRQFTSEGTFKAAQTQLPRLAAMGVDIIWLMPIHPIGEANRKGSLGSPYAVRDYRAVNPELGTEAEFRAFVDEAHRLGLKVILDWVANHSAYDNPLTLSHPEWYTRTPEGALTSPAGTDWSDVADFDYSQPALRQYMTESLVYWVRDFGIDGYRADVAGYVPTDFWETARAELNKVKPVFMLAEWEQRDLHARAFDATYGWGWKEAMQRLVKDGSGAGPMRGYYAGQSETWPRAAMRMVYTENHDQNSWDGVAAQIYGPAYEAAMALSFTGSGLPLIYNGQEADNDRQLKFFERDPIVWREGKHDALLRKLIALKTASPALHNGRFGAPMVEVPTSATADVYAFTRGDKGERVFAVFNLSPRARSITFTHARHHGSYTDALTGTPASFAGSETLDLPAWGYRIFQETN